jgi:isopenicillin N synthase-like dioxygenase
VSGIPVIDVAQLLTGSSEQAHAVAGDLGRACRDVGFFYVTGHRIPEALIAGVFENSVALFGGPASVREAASFSGPGGNRGYIKLGGETLDPGKPADVKEAFNIGLELAPDDPELVARAPFRAANLWPDMPGFRDTMLEYFNRVWRSPPCACCTIRRSQAPSPMASLVPASIPITAMSPCSPPMRSAA